MRGFHATNNLFEKKLELYFLCDEKSMLIVDMVEKFQFGTDQIIVLLINLSLLQDTAQSI